MAATGAPGAQAWAGRLRGARSPRPGPGWARVARPHSPGSGSDRGCSSSVAAFRDTQPGPGCADREGNSAAAAAATTADSSAWAAAAAAAAAERSRARSAAAAFMGQVRPRP